MAKSKSNEELLKIINDAKAKIAKRQRSLVKEYRELSYEAVQEMDREIAELTKEKKHAEGVLKRRARA